jgi:hypothetical protein
MEHVDILQEGIKVFFDIYHTLIDIGSIRKGLITVYTGTVARLSSLGDLVEELGTRLLKKLAVRVVVLERDTILLHDVVVKQLS